MSKEKDNKKVPFKAFSKKGLAAFALAGVMLSTPFALAGCGEAGPKGDTGATGAAGSNGKSAYELAVENGFTGTVQEWLDSLKGTNGTSSNTYVRYANVLPTSDADMLPEGTAGDYIGVYVGTTAPASYSSYTWHKIKGEKGEDGDIGPQGPQGNPGKDGISTYVGYDGYIWNGTTKTEFKVEDITLGETVVENTIGIEGYMSKYFEGSYIDLSSNTVALMANYKPNAGVTQYGGVSVKQIKVVAENAGNLYIGKAKVSDIVNARTTGASYTSTTTAFEVQEGLNVINLDLTLASDETIVLGGNGSVSLYTAHGISVNDEDGNYTYINSQTNVDVISKTSDIADTLAIQVSVSDIIDYSITPEILQTYPNGFESDTSKEFKEVQLGNAPFAFKNKTMYAGKTITKIGVYAKRIINQNNPFITVYKTKQNKTGSQKWTTDATSYKILFPTTIRVGEWCYADCHIEVAEDEMLAFGATSGDTIGWSYSGPNIPSYNFINNNNAVSGTVTEANILFDVWATDYSTFEEAWEHHLQDLEEQETMSALKNSLSNAGVSKISFLGDSITTYEGWSNNATDYNSTMGSNAVHYNDTKTASITSVNDTWWKQVLDATNTTLCVNNSYSGDKVTDNGVSRAVQLHDDTGNGGDVINPDMIFVYLGVNDFNSEVNIDTFAAKYEEMISGMKIKYTNAKIYVCTILPNNRYINKTLLDAYNEAIREIATRLELGLVDLYNDSGINYDNMLNYLWETGTNALHPNALGMDAMSNTVIKQLISDYVD